MTGCYFGVTQYLNIVPDEMMDGLKIFVENIEAISAGQGDLRKDMAESWEKSLDILRSAKSIRSYFFAYSVSIQRTGQPSTYDMEIHYHLEKNAPLHKTS